ncbi:hypothetical protein Q8A73_012494 [Channa argus]|nr:hypothetical protein Q8A73_012494 [Channa argus]
MKVEDQDLGFINQGQKNGIKEENQDLDFKNQEPFNGHCSVLVTIMSIIGSGEAEGVIVMLRRTFGRHPDYKSLSVPVIIVFSLSPPSPPIMTLLRLVAFIPYFISTYLVTSVHRSMKTDTEELEKSKQEMSDNDFVLWYKGLPAVVSMNMQPDVEGGQRCDEDFDDLTNVTTEHDF